MVRQGGVWGGKVVYGMAGWAWRVQAWNGVIWQAGFVKFRCGSLWYGRIGKAGDGVQRIGKAGTVWSGKVGIGKVWQARLG